MPDLTQRALPGMQAAYVRVDVTRTPDRGLTVTCYATDGPGFVTAADTDTYEYLTVEEAIDVVFAVLEAQL